MQTLFSWQSFPSAARGGVLCIGNFDGVHVGHQAMLTAGRNEARRRNCSFTIMTFDPHPSVLLRPGANRPPLSTRPQREQLLADSGADYLIVIPTTTEFLGITAEEFLAAVVRDALGAKVLVEGPTFTFGRGARGTVDMLQTRGGEYGIDTVIVATEQVALSDLSLVGVSSSLIRWLIENGRVADAANCLGRPYALRGEVMHGAKRGRTIGYPTANVATAQLLPAAGVYAGRAIVDGHSHLAAISIGTNPTFHETLTTVEAYLLDFTGDLYGKIIDVEFVRWIRDMIAFGGVEPLIHQMAKDVQLTRDMIQQKESA